jgi:ATP-dependent protease ClpP protease subunit
VKESFIRLLAPINQGSASALLQTVDNLLKMGTNRIHLLISSPGGDVAQGISVYNYLKHIPAELYTYNFGSVDSIGVVIYSAGIKRFCEPRARFLIHNPSVNLQGNGVITMDEKQVEEILKGLKIDQENIAGIIADTTNKDIESVKDLMNARTTFNFENAKEFGLAHEISKLQIPMGETVTAIGPVSAENIPMPIPVPAQILQNGIPQGVPIAFPGQQINRGFIPRK